MVQSSVLYKIEDVAVLGLIVNGLAGDCLVKSSKPHLDSLKQPRVGITRLLSSSDCKA